MVVSTDLPESETLDKEIDEDEATGCDYSALEREAKAELLFFNVLALLRPILVEASFVQRVF